MDMNLAMGSNTEASTIQSYRNPTLSQLNSGASFMPGGPGGSMYRKPSYPYLVIMEQPKARGLRFRYECEGRSAGAIPGENSVPETRTYPTIKIENMDASSAVIVVSCVSKDDPARPHPHSLTGQNCQKGVCTAKLTNTDTISFRNLGIQCVKKKGIEESLATRACLKVDPFTQGYSDKNHDLTTVRLCFQAFLPDQNGKYCRIIKPVVSTCIYDKKAVSDLVICRISKQAGSVHGGEQVFIFTEKIQKDNIAVRFFETTDDGLVWEAYGEFGQGDVHRQYAIVITTPPYRNSSITQPVTVFFQLQRPSDKVTSEPKPFQYIPEDPDPDGLTRKKRKLNYSNYFSDDPLPYANASAQECTADNVRHRLKATLCRRGKQASTMTSDSTYPGNGAVTGNGPVTGNSPVTTPSHYLINNMDTVAQSDLYTAVITDAMMAGNTDPLQSVMNATFNNPNTASTVDMSQLNWTLLDNTDMLSVDSTTARYLTDSFQHGDNSFGSIPSFPDAESGLQGDLSFPTDQNIGANEVIPPK